MKAAGQAATDSRDAHTRHVIVGTAGHIDHGKTALVYALTGTDTDRLPEEKQRGITIDLGFAALELDHPQHGRLHLSLIDVPGHHAFIRNMLAGTGGIDCVMLVVAADEGVKAQTQEHLAICTLLGIERGIVVLTKCDAVSPEQLRDTRASLARFVAGTFLAEAPILAVSALRGDGIPALKTSLSELAAGVPPRGAGRVLRLPLDRAFSMRGFGTVVTGTLQSGAVRIGDALEQHPAGRVLRVRGLQVHGENHQAGHPPCRVALNLSGVEVAQIARGDTLTVPRTLAPTATVDVDITMLRDAPPLKHGGSVRVHAFTSETTATILFFDQRNSAEQGSGLARLRLAKPLLLAPGDRMVLRQCSPPLTVGGGRVLDAAPLAGMRKATALEYLKQLQSADLTEQLRLRIARRGMEGIALEALVAETGLVPVALRRRLEPLVANRRVIECVASQEAPTHWITAEALAEALRAAEHAISAAGSLPRSELRSRTRLNAAVFGAVLQRLSASAKFECAGELARAAGRGDSLPESRRNQMQAIESIYAKAGLAAPLLSEVEAQLGVAPGGLRQSITLLLRSGRLVRMGADNLFVHPSALNKLYTELRRLRGQSFDVGRFKSFTGLTRKHAIPLLEHLDQVRVTRNNGGMRIVL